MSESLQRVRVALGERSYEILIGRDLLSRTGKFLQPLGLGKRGVIITDSNVGPRYAGVVLESLAQSGFQAEIIEIPSGETSKSLRQANRLFEKLPGMKLDRHSFVVALGGGVVGDLAGYIAACYLRGINFIQIPTSLLAQVDSSIGGKTGVNLPHGKNLVGAFYQPRLVLADTDTLATLSKRELRSGFAEVIKYGAIADAKFFSWLEKNHRQVLKLEPAALAKAVRRCCELKAMVVGKDERESGLREILNFGHTVGHAMEALADYTGLLHGEAVGVGMCTAGCLSVVKAGLRKTELRRLRTLIRSSGLPVKPQKDYGLERVLMVMRLDKKARAGKLRFVLLKRLGKAFSSDAVTDEDVEKALEDSDVCCDETIVREYFEAHGFLVCQRRKYIVQTRQKTGDEEVDLIVSNPRATAGAVPGEFELTSETLGQVSRAIVAVKGWHTEVFAPGVLAHQPKIFRFVESRAVEEAKKLVGADGLLKILVVPGLPRDEKTRQRSIDVLKSKGVDAVISFRSILQELIAGVKTNRNYQKSDVLQILRLLKNYELLKEPQMELRFRKRSSKKSPVAE